MNTVTETIRTNAAQVLCGMLAVMFLGTAVCHAEENPAQAERPKSFDTPDAAFKAFLDCCHQDDDDALLSLMGRQHKDLVVQSDKAHCSEIRGSICSAAKEHLNVVTDGDKATAYLGIKAWPYPIPIVKKNGSWFFDAAAGKEEILNRRIGFNELCALKLIDAFGDAQREYGSLDNTGDQVLKFAQKFKSSPAKKDGLYWAAEPANNAVLSPMEANLDDWAEVQDREDSATLYNGYAFKILTKQGASPPNGKYDYVINGNMIAGFALVAWPVDYNTSGIMTFTVSHSGIVYEKDLGTDTAKVASEMEEYNPDKTWTEVNPEEK